MRRPVPKPPLPPAELCLEGATELGLTALDCRLKDLDPFEDLEGLEGLETRPERELRRQLGPDSVPSQALSATSLRLGQEANNIACGSQQGTAALLMKPVMPLRMSYLPAVHSYMAALMTLSCKPNPSTSSITCQEHARAT